jgi:hypothetical protein
MLRELERRIRRLRDKLLGREEIRFRRNFYWQVSHIVSSVIGDGRLAVTMSPEDAVVSIHDPKVDATTRITHQSLQGRFLVEMHRGETWKKLAQLSDLQNAAFAAIRGLLAVPSEQGRGSDEKGPVRWVPLVDGKRVPRMLNLGPQWTTALHRSGWEHALEPLYSLHDPRGVLFDGFLEATFCWRETGIVYDKPWVGVIHNPHDMPPWAGNGESTNRHLLKSQSWKKSRRNCRGLFVLSKALRDSLAGRVDVPISVVYHPTETPELKFSVEAFEENSARMIVQIGHWLRHPNSLYKLSVSSIKKARLDVGHPWEEDLRKHLPKEPIDLSSVEVIPRLSNNEYDRLLSQNIVFLDLLGSSANNAVVECIVRNTPVLVNPLDAVVEYLGPDYPFYFRDLEEAAQKAQCIECIRRTHQYLKDMPKEQFTQEAFLQSVITSEVYQSLLRRSSEALLVLAHARSGSTSLLKVLDAHEDFRMVNEPFNPTREKWGHNYRDEVSNVDDLDHTLDELFHYYNGMKHLIYQLPEELNHHLLKRAGRRILLFRRNTLQAVVSAMIATQTGIWFGNRKHVLKHEMEPLDINEVSARVAWVQESVQKYRQFLIEHDLPFLELAYEDVFDRRLATSVKLSKIKEIFDFLGVEELDDEVIGKIREILNPRKHKLNSDETYQRIPNVREIDKRLANAQNGYVLQVARPADPAARAA